MFKSIAIFSNIENPEAFQEFYIREVFPIVHEWPGVTHTHVTSVIELGDEPNVNGIRLIIETYFTSQDAMFAVFGLPSAQEVMGIAAEKALGEIYFFTGEEKSVDLVELRKTQEAKSKSSKPQRNRLLRYLGWRR